VLVTTWLGFSHHPILDYPNRLQQQQQQQPAPQVPPTFFDLWLTFGAFSMATTAERFLSCLEYP
jgi:hypothetical protein